MRKEGLHARVGLQLVSHQAAALAGEGAMGLWLFCTMYSRLHELDGFVPQSVAERCWSGNLRANRAHLLKLCSVAVGLAISASHPTLGPGFVMLKYAEFNETKSEIEERRSANRGRQRTHRESRESVSRVTNALVTDSDSVSAVLDPELGSGSPREGYAASATHCPPDLALTPEAEAYAAMPGLTDIPLVWTKFVAHYSGGTGGGQRATDWYTQWRKWVADELPRQRRERERARGSGSYLRAVPDTPAAPYHRVAKGYERTGDEPDTPGAVRELLAAAGLT